MKNEENKRNIINFSDARKRKRTSKHNLGNGHFRNGATRSDQSSTTKEYAATIVRWIQFIFLLALSTYVLQRCGVL